MLQVFADTETTGMNPSEGHRIVELALIEVVDRVPTGKKLHYYINPERDIDPEAQAVHGLSREMLKDKPKFREIAKEVSEFLKGADEFLAHNAQFDVRFLDEELGRMKSGTVKEHVVAVVDTLKIAKEFYPGKKNSLDALCDRLGVDTSARDLHGALLDTELLVEAYMKMTDGVDLSFDPDAPKSLGVINRLPSDRKLTKVVHASSQEASAHAGYLAEMEKDTKVAPIFVKGVEQKMEQKVEQPVVEASAPSAPPPAGDAPQAPKFRF